MENYNEHNLETLNITMSDFNVSDSICFIDFTYENDTNDCFLSYNIFSGVDIQRKNIQKKDFDYFSNKISNITKNWKDYYGRDTKNNESSQISWQIIFDRNDKNKIYGGNDYPVNWNEFMDCLSEIKSYFNL